MYEDYKKLDLYKHAYQLILDVYKVTKNFPKEELFGVVNQMRRAAVSAPANFVEGYGRKSEKEKIQFCHIAIGSLNELGFYITGLKRKSSSRLPAPSSQSGQSLIETIMALFILTTGLSAGLALAIYAFGASSDIVEKVSATGLAREGIETVRRMRDSNWLNDDLEYGGDCGTAELCYEDWLNDRFDIRGATGGVAYRLSFDPSATGNKWTLLAAPPGPAANYYQLYREPQGGFTHASSGTTPTNLFRKIIILYQQITPPYTATSPLLLVRSVVWWHGKNCPQILDYVSPSDTSCKIVSEEYLTNWRNY